MYCFLFAFPLSSPSLSHSFSFSQRLQRTCIYIYVTPTWLSPRDRNTNDATEYRRGDGRNIDYRYFFSVSSDSFSSSPWNGCFYEPLDGPKVSVLVTLSSISLFLFFPPSLRPPKLCTLTKGMRYIFQRDGSEMFLLNVINATNIAVD